MPEGLAERYDARIAGVLSCYGRIVITGTVPGTCHAKGMTAFLCANAIRIFDYPQFAATLRDKVRGNAAKVAEAAGAAIEHISKSHFPVPAAKIAHPPPALIVKPVRPFSATAAPRRFFGRRVSVSTKIRRSNSWPSTRWSTRKPGTA